MLTDPDLDAARGREGWAEFEGRSAAIAESQTVIRPKTLMRAIAEPVGTIVALHGAGAVPEDSHEQWLDAVPSNWTLISPVGDVPTSEVAWAWPFDLETDSLSQSLDGIDLRKPVVLVGFSQGSSMAAKAAWNGVVDAIGMIVTAPTLPIDLWESSEKRPVAMYAVVGTEDRAYHRCTEVARDLRRDGVPVLVDTRRGMGHVPPEDLDQVIGAGLEWIMAQSG